MARLGSEAGLVVVVEEGVQTGTIHENIRASVDPQTPSLLASFSRTLREFWVEVRRVDREAAGECIGVRLHIGCLGLDDTHVDILSACDLVIVELAVLRASTVEPDGTLGFDEDAAAVVDVNLFVVGEVELVVCYPEPVKMLACLFDYNWEGNFDLPIVLKVDGGLLCDVQHEECTLASRIDWVCRVGVLGARVGLKTSASGTTDTHMYIPHA